jgi:type II restriction/modification system DNA methylase subunit YeeA
MAVPAFSFCETYNSTLAAVALTKQTAEEAIAEFDAMQAEKAAAAASEDAEDDESDSEADDAPRMM